MTLNKSAIITIFATVIFASCNMDGYITDGKDYGDTHYRPATINSNPYCTKVFEYTPAPGQFINETKTGGFNGSQTTAEAACAYAEERFATDIWVSLGGFGGYIVVGFDHSIENTGGYDFAVLGNSFNGSSEPGIVWVMQDENGNGLPDDTWYELAGSETGKAETIHNYAVTYYRPSALKTAVRWSDNLGNSGEIAYLGGKNGYTDFPLWMECESYTLTGTCLKARNYNDGTNWGNPYYGWGYADNESPEDFFSTSKSNRFDIANAIDAEGNAKQLEYIYFVKVQCAVNAVSGSLGEISTEICGVRDLNAVIL